MMNASSQINNDLQRLIYRVERYLRLVAAERLTVLATCVVLGAIALALATSAIFFLSTGVVQTVALLTGSETLSYYVVGIGLLLIIWIVYLFRKPLIENRFVRVFSRQLLEKPTMVEELLTKADKDAQIHRLAESLAREMDGYDEEGGSV
ncbi:MAG: hypothetical protein K2H04_03615 [Bacteroidaceae bacterium]|nr:hypothetical protein [Bacteroidaceae bacterium]MDE6720692.1 hypothetical protein [Bacteroidaceae bacterium]